MCNERTGKGGCPGPGHFMGHFFEGGHGITRRFLRPVVLLLLAETPCHGYELMGKLKEFGMDQSSMDPSILYRMLRNMERDCLLYTSDAADDLLCVDLGGRRIIK